MRGWSFKMALGINHRMDTGLIVCNPHCSTRSHYCDLFDMCHILSGPVHPEWQQSYCPLFFCTIIIFCFCVPVQSGEISHRRPNKPGTKARAVTPMSFITDQPQANMTPLIDTRNVHLLQCKLGEDVWTIKEKFAVSFADTSATFLLPSFSKFNLTSTIIIVVSIIIIFTVVMTIISQPILVRNVTNYHISP